MSDKPYEIIHGSMFPELEQEFRDLDGKYVVLIKDKSMLLQAQPKGWGKFFPPAILSASFVTIALLSTLVVMQLIETEHAVPPSPEISTVAQSEVDVLKDQIAKVVSVTKFLVTQSKVMQNVVAASPEAKSEKVFKPQLVGRFTADKVRIRRSPSAEADVIATVAKDSQIAVQECSSGWCSVFAPNGEAGWVAAEFLQVTYVS